MGMRDGDEYSLKMNVPWLTYYTHCGTLWGFLLGQHAVPFFWQQLSIFPQESFLPIRDPHGPYGCDPLLRLATERIPGTFGGNLREKETPSFGDLNLELPVDILLQKTTQKTRVTKWQRCGRRREKGEKLRKSRMSLTLLRS